MALPHLHSFLRCSMWSFMLHHLAVKEVGFACFSHYSPNPTPNIFIPGKPGQKHQMVMHQCEGSGSLKGSRAFPTSTLPVLCILLSSLMALQSPGWTVLNVLSSSVSRSILTTKMHPVAYDDGLQIWGDFVFMSKALLQFPLAGVSKNSCQVLPSQCMP